MKTNFIILGVAMLISADYAKSQCTTAVNNSGASGTQYYVPKYSQTGAPCIQNSSIYDNGNVGIGTTFPGSYKLFVNGDSYISGDLDADYITAIGYYGHSGQACAYTYASNAMFGTDWAATLSNGGTYNAFMGAYSAGWNTSGSYNTHMGAYAGYYNSTGNGNTTAGYYSGLGVINNNYSNNTFFGYKTGFATTTGGNNVFVGYQAGTANTYAAENVAITDIVHIPADDNDNYSIAYGGLVVPLVQSVQELSKTVDSLKTEIALLQNTRPIPTENPNNTQQIVLSNTDIILYQNEPNPFDNKTVIRYFIPANTTGTAYISFYDMYGNEISKNEIAQKGSGQIEVNTANLSSGVYSYSLIINGSVFETRKMMKSK